MRSLLCSLALIIELFSSAFAQAFSEGDTVRLVERDIHIPAHPAAGDNQVPLRFTRGSTALILAIGPHPFIVLGDFNRRFNRPQDLVWTNLDDADPPNADLTAVTVPMPISGRDNRFVEFIDHLVFDKRAAAFVDRTFFRHVTCRQVDKEVWDKISDHCPVVVEMWV